VESKTSALVTCGRNAVECIVVAPLGARAVEARCGPAGAVGAKGLGNGQACEGSCAEGGGLEEGSPVSGGIISQLSMVAVLADGRNGGAQQHLKICSLSNLRHNIMLHRIWFDLDGCLPL